MSGSMKKRVPLIAFALTLASLIGAAVLVFRPIQAEQGMPLAQYVFDLPAPTIGPNPTMSAGLAAHALFIADFAAADSLNEWQMAELDFILPEDRANWIIDNGRLRQNFAGELQSSSLNQIAALAPGVYEDGVVRVSFYDEVNGVAGLIARYQGEVGYEADYYRLRVLKNEYEASPKYVLSKVVDGVAIPLAEVAGPGFTPRQWNVLELELRGSELTARLNDKLLLRVTDTQALPEGRMGIYTRALGGILFDDFIIAP